MVKTFAVSAGLIPFIIAAIITVFGIYKRRKAKCNKCTLIFPACSFGIILISQIGFWIKIVCEDTVDNLLGLGIFFIGYLILDFSYFLAMQPSEYNASFDASLLPLIIGIFVLLLGFGLI